MFLKFNKNPNRKIDVYICTSTETDEFSETFEKIKDNIIQQSGKNKK